MSIRNLRTLVALAAGSFVALVSGASEILPPTPCYQGQCAQTVESNAEESSPAPVSGRVPSAGGIKWNPGMYQILDLPRALSDLALERYLRAHPACQADYPWFEGFKIRLHWREYEASPRNYSAGDEVIARVLEKLETHCGNRRLMLHTDFHANHYHAGPPKALDVGKLCIPSDLIDYVIQRTPEQAAKSTYRCMAPVWNASTPVQQRHTELVEHIGRTWNSHPRFEGYFPKGEGSIGRDIEDNDPNYDRLRFESYMFDLALRWRKVAPATWYALGTNNHAGIGIDGSQNLKDYWVPWLRENALGIGVHWPDTHTLRNFPGTQAHLYHPNEWANQIAMVGEWQRPGITFKEFSDVHDACCNSNGYKKNGQEVTWAASHPIMGFLSGGATDANTQQDMFNIIASRVNSGKSAVYTKSCPRRWTDAGGTCVTGQL